MIEIHINSCISSSIPGGSQWNTIHGHLSADILIQCRDNLSLFYLLIYTSRHSYSSTTVVIRQSWSLENTYSSTTSQWHGSSCLCICTPRLRPVWNNWLDYNPDIPSLVHQGYGVFHATGHKSVHSLPCPSFYMCAPPSRMDRRYRNV